MSQSLRSFVSLTVFGVCIGLAPSSHAGECPGGSVDASECIRQLKVAEGNLLRAYAGQEDKIKKRFGTDGYGQTEGMEFVKQAIEAFRASNSAWLSYRDADCWYQALNDGMSINYANVVAAACKVERTQERLRSFK
jgi:uncharacterized protein YecT (DUF1311 family)